MPQLDIFSFPAQVAWLALIVFLFLLVSTKYVLPDALAIAEARKNYLITKGSKKASAILKTDVKFEKTLRSFSKSFDLINASLENNNLLQETTLKNIGFKAKKKLKKLNLKNTLIKITPFTFGLNLNDNLILVIAFFVFFILVSYFLKDINFPWNDRINELNSTFSSCDNERLDVLTKKINYLEETKEFKKIFQSLYTLYFPKIESILENKKNLQRLTSSLLPLVVKKKPEADKEKKFILNFFSLSKK